MKRVLGLDIGIASVGWGVIDIESGEIVDAGVRLFTEAAKENNEKRRGFRSSRRLKRRRVNRKEDLMKLLQKHNLYHVPLPTNNPYELRCKGLNEKLSLPELNAALFHICKHRGSALEVIEDDSKSDNQGATKASLAENDKAIQSGKYVCEIQLERLNQNGKLRGINNNFRSSDYKKELEKLLETQGIDNEVAQEIIDCILRRRHFADGPGSFKSPTIYGRIYDENGNVLVGMIEKMTGKCSIFPNELRAPKMSPSAEFFNLLNDLNNLKIDDEPLEIEAKQALLDFAFHKGSITPNQIAKNLNAVLEDISGFRIDKDDKPLISKLEGFKSFKKILDEYGKSELLSDFGFLDKIAVTLTKTKVKEERIAEIADLFLNKSIEASTNLIEAFAVLPKFTGYHALSLKALNLMNEELYETTLNQMQILQVSNKFELVHQHHSQKGKQKISIDENAILSPVAMRSYRQAIKVVNAARKRFGEFDSIIIETTRDKNSAEQKKKINERQKYFKAQNDKVDKILANYPGIKVNGLLRTKIKLYSEQDGKTAYTQQPIDLDLLIRDATAYEVDHILPISISLDDSINNKVLTTHTENQQKGQLTPVMAFEKGKFTNGSFTEYKKFAYYLKNKNAISWKKYSNYVYAKDINQYENMKEFIARNLVDTSYANRLVFNTLMSYFKDNEISTKVHTIKGVATSAFRKRIKGLEKDRDLDYSHHAIDALIVASIKKLNLYNQLLCDFSISGKDVVYNRETGEIVESNQDLLLDGKYINFLNHLVQYEVKNYSHQIDTKPNRSIADQTIYSTRNYGDGDVVIKKYKNIYDPKFTTLADNIVNNECDKYLMAKHDPLTFEKIKNIVLHYYEEFKADKDKVKIGKNDKVELSFNPLAMHQELTGEVVTKYSKKGNGPIITSMKYIDGKLGSHVDISQNYDLKNKKVVLQQISPYRTDFYLDEGVYKFVTVRYSNVQYSKTSHEYFIDEDWYNKQKKAKKISDKASFCFSLHRNELLEITDDKGCNLWKFTATNNDAKNIIEVKPIHTYEKKQLMLTIGKKIKLLRKISCDPLGKMTEIKDSNLKLQFK